MVANIALKIEERERKGEICPEKSLANSNQKKVMKVERIKEDTKIEMGRENQRES